MFLIIDVFKIEFFVYICCLVMWEVFFGYILRRKWRGIIVLDLWEFSYWILEDKRYSVGAVKRDF